MKQNNITITAHDEIYLISPPMFLPAGPIDDHMFGSQFETGIGISSDTIKITYGANTFLSYEKDGEILTVTGTIRVIEKNYYKNQGRLIGALIAAGMKYFAFGNFLAGDLIFQGAR